MRPDDRSTGNRIATAQDCQDAKIAGLVLRREWDIPNKPGGCRTPASAILAIIRAMIAARMSFYLPELRIA